MKVVGLDGQTYTLSLSDYKVEDGDLRPRSKLHLAARAMLKEMYPTMQVLEEVPARVDFRTTLFMDFFIPILKTCVEVHGQQHYEFNSMFHVNKMAFLNQKKRDQKKRNWCAANNIKLVELKYDEQDKWRESIRN